MLQICVYIDTYIYAFLSFAFSETGSSRAFEMETKPVPPPLPPSASTSLMSVIWSWFYGNEKAGQFQ